MAADALLAGALLVGLSVLRFGPDWAVVWRGVIPEPRAFLALYVTAWVVALMFNGLYRPRARWSLRGEALDVLKATGAMALATLSILFRFKLPDVSRLFLVSLFPLQAGLTIALRAALRIALVRARQGGRNTRYVLVLGAGARGREFARKVEDHVELGLRVAGFLDEEEPFVPGAWRRLGDIADLERVLHERVIDEVAICLPFSRWEEIYADRPHLRGGGQDRPHPDGGARPDDLDRADRGARRDARLLARLRARPGLRARDEADLRRRRGQRRPCRAQPRPVADRGRGRSLRTAGRSSSTRSASASMAAPSGCSSSARWSVTPRPGAASWPTAISCRGGRSR